MITRQIGPQLSFVATARNDDHGGNLLDRLQMFIDGLADQCERYKVKSELVLVEWNPPSDRATLIDTLDWPPETSYSSHRIIQVPSELHHQFEHSDRLPLFQMIAKNVGIRRARGDFVLVTNIDILFSDEFFSFLSEFGLRHDRLYRVDRYDVSPPVPVQMSARERLEHCRANVTRINSRDRTADIVSGEGHEIRSSPTQVSNWARLVPDPLKKLGVYSRFRTSQSRKHRLHTNASGDFTLMARSHWHDIRGYPEWPLHGANLDALLCYVAHFAGVQEAILQDPIRAYHMEHERRWSPHGFSPEGSRTPAISNEQLGEWVNQMRLTGKPIIFNSTDWGLGSAKLYEWNTSE